jgi:hypothetical protein
MDRERSPRRVGLLGLILVATLSLLRLLLAHDFNVEYVASYSSSTLPVWYTVAALWGGMKGSLLWWTCILAVFNAIVLLQNRSQNLVLMPWVTAVMLTVGAFFLSLLVFVTDPFERLPFTPAEGSDLNPLLQNYWMTIHPPSLYLGFVSRRFPSRSRLRPWRRAGSATPGSRPGAGRCSRGSSSAWGISSEPPGRTSSSAGAATGPGIRSRTPPSCRGSR